ncbi:MAG TPA: class I SAM-dependent methyltransferase [Solirubrobacterales bacterium]|nr:class I SAM-dependent methyltransferase [Solirubrobacterales bacterium]
MDPVPRLTPLAAAVLHVGAPERILQLECGEGEAALFLAREFPSARVRGVDRSSRAIRRAASRIGLDPEGRVAFKQGNPRALPFPEDHFDLVASLDSRPSPAEVARVLRPGGFLVLTEAGRRDAPAGRRGLLLQRRLARLGFEPIWSQPAGDGSFSVFRLGGGEAAGRAL